MDFDQYVAARYGRLIEHAVLLGCAEGEAGTYVDQVLLEQRKRIRRAEDPDPLVHEALERAISGTPERSRRAGPLVAIGLVVVAVAVGAGADLPATPAAGALAVRARREPGPAAARGPGLRRPAPAGSLLRARGPGARVRPAAGHPVREGATVTVRTAVPSDVFCQALFLTRADAWDFVSFALGGDAPPFADTVRLLVPGSTPRTFTGQEAADGGRWDEAFDLIATAAHDAAPTLDRDAVAAGRRRRSRPTCGAACRVRPRPGDASRSASRSTPRQPRNGVGCPLTIDLYRSERVDRHRGRLPGQAD